MFKFLHAADIHLDSPLHGLDRYQDAPVEQCRGATRRALQNLVKLAIHEHVAFVLIAGDVYDGTWPDYNTGLFFIGRMAELNHAGIDVVLISGNHDAQNKMTRDLRLPPGTHRFGDTEAQTLPLTNCPVVVHGQSYARWDLKDNLALGYPNAIPGVFNIGLLHTALEGRDQHERYAPCTLDDLRVRDYHYWALGHIHSREAIRDADPFIGFPGNLQGRHVREAGAKGCWLVTVDPAHNVTVEPRALDVLRWKTCRVDADGASDGEDVLNRVDLKLRDEVAAADDLFLALRVELTGASPAHAELAANLPRWVNEIRGAAIRIGDGRLWIEKVVARTRPPSTPDDHSEGPVAELHALLHELKTNAELCAEFDGRALGELRKRFDPNINAHDLLDQVGHVLLYRLSQRS